MKNDNRFPVLYSDFPWRFRNVKTGGSHTSGSSQKYSTMPMEEIAKFPIHDFILDDGIHFMWVPVPLKFEVVDIVNGWGGFSYKTTITWKKVDGIGMGWWARGVMEELWILVKGNVKALRWQGKNMLEETNVEGRLPAGFMKAKTGQIHSRKPERMYEIIEEMTSPYPTLGSMLELFATKGRPDWTSVGFEMGSDVYEYARHLKLHGDQSKKCSICGWDYKEDPGSCRPADCSERPRPKNIHDPYRARLEGQLEPIQVAA